MSQNVTSGAQPEGVKPRRTLPGGGQARLPGLPGAMRLLLLAPRRAQTGNGTTVRRIQDHLEAAGHTCILKDTSDFESPLTISDLISSESVDASLGIHLYRAGRLLQGSNIPFGIIFGGTDINEDAKRNEKSWVMGAVLDEARFAVSFTEAMKETAAAYWPPARNKIYVQSQGIVTAPSTSFNQKAFLQRAGILQDNNSVHLFLLICGLRRVKDPLFLVDAVAEWHRKEPGIHLIIIGPEVEAAFAEEVKEKVKTSCIHGSSGEQDPRQFGGSHVFAEGSQPPVLIPMLCNFMLTRS
ncbi:glycosyltransferase 1 domain-containing protein 1 isoform X6 [Hemicordylus capensis]|uniref:glycosyltransferase 1 domain-containing protein 1 isoform X6 n=1 Tax=Hemicordylus capensis TaxID=884348 RepID=UPI00230355C0|nr:glycosyltransferase 1 domain-containing protein 1 isoform X6 [Hemicordylus capensis]